MRHRVADIETVRLIGGTHDNVISKMPIASYQYVVIVSVLEHIKDNLTVIGECRRLLKPRGHLRLMVTAPPYLFRELNRKVGHYRYYERGNLSPSCLKVG